MELTTDRDRLLTAEQAADALAVSVKWLYRQAPHLPFAKRLSARVIRFSEQGLWAWLKEQRG